MSRLAMIAMCAAALACLLPEHLLAQPPFVFTYVGAGFEIPDAQAGVGPGSASSGFSLTSSGLIQNVEVRLVGLNHTWMGDLIATLTFDPTGPAAPINFDLIRRVGSSTTSGFGDSSDFNGTYFFSDTGAERVIDVAGLVANGNTFVLPSGTFRASTNTFNGVGSPTFTGETVLNFNAVFGDRSESGDWLLTISDNGGGNVGTLERWELVLTTVPEPVGLSALAGATMLLARGRRTRLQKKSKASLAQSRPSGSAASTKVDGEGVGSSPQGRCGSHSRRRPGRVRSVLRERVETTSSRMG